MTLATRESRIKLLINRLRSTSREFPPGEGAVELSLQFEDNSTLHEDLVLRFAGQSWICDSYYLALDRQLLPEREDAEKVVVVLRQLLGQWLSAVERVPDGGTVYLRYDFSDQCTGWLRCERSRTVVDVCRGWSEVEGWSLHPSAVVDHFTRVPGFRPDGPAVQVPFEELMEAIRASMSEVA